MFKFDEEIPEVFLPSFNLNCYFILEFVGHDLVKKLNSDSFNYSIFLSINDNLSLCLIEHELWCHLKLNSFTNGPILSSPFFGGISCSNFKNRKKGDCTWL